MSLAVTARMAEAGRLYGDGYTFPEIAVKLSVSQRTAKYLVTEARRRLGIDAGPAGRRELRERLAES